jgi:hypothetical protein
VTNSIIDITDLFAPISLADINARAGLQKRTDNKYFVPWPIFVEFSQILSQTFSVMEIDNRRVFSYDTQYFDTSDLHNYWCHVQGRRKRFKSRSRIYDTGLCVFELKVKNGRNETVKYKINYKPEESRQITPAAEQFLHSHLSAYGLDMQFELIPTLHNTYQRVTFAGPESAGGERVTCDLNLMFGEGDSWTAQLSEQVVLLEIKSARGRGFADQLLWRMGIRPGSGSKYCVGMSLIRDDLRFNRFARTRNRFFERADRLEALAVNKPVERELVLGQAPSNESYSQAARLGITKNLPVLAK